MRETIPPPPPPSRAGHRILVVEDDTDLRQLNTEVLRHSGYRVDSAEDGAGAWDALTENRYDLVLTDNQMPKVCGIELLVKLRAARMEVPVVMATGTIPQEEFKRSPWLQPAAVLLKPYTLAELLRVVQQILPAACAAESPPPGRQFPPMRTLGPEVRVLPDSAPPPTSATCWHVHP